MGEVDAGGAGDVFELNCGGVVAEDCADAAIGRGCEVAGKSRSDQEKQLAPSSARAHFNVTVCHLPPSAGSVTGPVGAFACGLLHARQMLHCALWACGFGTSGAGIVLVDWLALQIVLGMLCAIGAGKSLRRLRRL